MSEVQGSFDEFLRKAAELPLLTREQEVMLAKRIEKGDHRARQLLVEHNIRLAVHQARKWQTNDVPLEDLVQEAIIGLDRAAEKFDWRKGFKFSTYATWWIRHMLQRAVHRDRSTIRVPGHIIERKRKIDKFMRLNPGATLEEAAIDGEITLAQAKDALEGARVVASLDAPHRGEDTGDKYDMIADDSAVDPSEIISPANPRLEKALLKLEPLQRRVIELRFGFDGEVMSRDDVAKKLGVRAHVVQRSQRAGLAALKRELE